MIFSKKNIIMSFILLILVGIVISEEIFRNKQRQAENRVVLVHASPNKEGIFWARYSKFMSLAFSDLGYQHESYGSDWNFIKMINKIHSLSKEKIKPTAMVFDHIGDNAMTLLDICDNANIPCLSVDAELSAWARKIIEGSKKKYKNFIGELISDDVGAGQRLLKELIKKAKPAEDGKIYLLALAGHKSTATSVNRVKGLKQALKNTDNVVLVDVISAEWSKGIAANKFLFYKTVKEPRISAVWAANDLMALGAIESAKKLGINVGRDLVVAGMNWSKEAIESINKGEMLGVMGGHSFDGAWAAILVHDYLHGCIPTGKYNIWKTEMHFLSKDTYPHYKKLIEGCCWNTLDFKKFSKAYNPELKEYDFSLNKILKQLN